MNTHLFEAQLLTTANRRRLSVPHARKDIEELYCRIYGPSDLTSYTLKDRLIIRAADIVFYSMLGAICSTLQWELRGREHFDAVVCTGQQPIYAFWHACIVSAAWFWQYRDIVVMSSLSRDAEYTGRVIKRFGYGTARGSATRGGGRALAEMAKCLNNDIGVAFTIDGPRGPAYVAKPGAVTLARHTGNAILPFHMAATRYIELSSWDRLQIPIPHSKVICMIGEPIHVSRNATSEEVAAKQKRLQNVLDDLRAEAAVLRNKT